MRYPAIALLLVSLTWGCGVVVKPTPVNISPLVQPTLMAEECLTVSSTPVWKSTGELVLSSISQSYSLINMGTGRRTTFVMSGRSAPGNFSESRDRNWLAYVYTNQDGSDELVVQSVDGKKKFTYAKDFQEWDTIAYWLNDQTLVLWHHASPLDSIVLLNPFTGEKTRLDVDYPNKLALDDDWDSSWPSVTVYSPSLNHLVYLATPSGGFKPARATMVLWDRQTNRSIASVNDLGVALVPPLWKADESGLVYVKSKPGMNVDKNADEVHFLSVDGVDRQITRLGDSFVSATIERYNWSADDRLLAINMQGVEEAGQAKHHLLVLDMSDLKVTDYCLAPEAFSPLLWSPDSQQLAFAEQLPDGNVRTVVIDPARKGAFVVAENQQPAGWLLPDK